MLSPIRLSLSLLTVSLIAATVGSVSSSNKPEDDPIAALDCAVHERFQDRKSFGMARMLPDRFHGVNQFMAENFFEQRAVSELESKGYQVTMFLVGRWALEHTGANVDPARMGLQGPAYITHAHADAPDSAKLLALGRQALVAFSRRDGYDVREGEWTAALRPLRATNGACVQCHAGQGVKVGDALGAAIYVYRKL
jgi:hypothetical protein